MLSSWLEAMVGVLWHVVGSYLVEAGSKIVHVEDLNCRRGATAWACDRRR
jgi:hypothetical protein